MGDGRGRVRVEVLGPIRVLDDDGADRTPTGLLQRRLLALLVLRRGRVVPAEVAIDVLWPRDLPADPSAALQNHLSRLRRTLPEGAIDSVGDGYRLDPSAIDLDCDRVAAAVSDGASADAATLHELDAVLQRWQDPAFPELEEVDDARAEGVRLAELRLRARELRAEHRLAQGETDGLVAELSAMVDADPLRERPRALLMGALAATGRHVEALRVYDDFRRLLGDELGIEPSPELTAQHAALLAGESGRAPTEWVAPSRLPTLATSLVGRGELAEDVAALVGPCRLVSLVGPGGVGKTRLLVEVGHLVRADAPDRPVVLCELAAADERSVGNLVAASLGIDARTDIPLAHQVASVLGDDELVLLLDNCEHVLEPAAELVDHLLSSCPRLLVVVTSRERLRVAGEHVAPVPPLPIDGVDAPAMQLFVERARAAAPGFDPDDAERITIAEVVRRLDGLPLAIELAAARLYTHGLDEVRAGLDERFALLSSGYRTSARHGSLAAAVSWSFDLLDERLQETFTALSAFAGPFDTEAAAAVCDVDRRQISEALAQLVERSLVMRTGDGRYVLLETLRDFGAEELRRRGRDDEVAARHARHQVAWAEDADRRTFVPGEPAIAEIDAALPELHLALGWLLDHGEVDLAGRLVAALLDYGLLRLRPDVLAWSERVVAADPDGRSPHAARVLVVAAYAAWMAGDVAETGRLSSRALAVAEASEAPFPPEVASIRGNVELFEGRLDEAVRWHRRAAEVAGTDDPAQRLLSSATELLALGYAEDPSASDRADQVIADLGRADDTAMGAYVWYCAGEAVAGVDVDRALARFERALELADRTGAAFVTGTAGASKASLDARLGDPEVAAEGFRELIAHWRRAGMWSTQWTMLRSIAGLLSRRGRDRDAAVLIGAIQATEAGHRIFGADEVALAELDAHLRRSLGDDEYARARAEGARLDGDAAVEHALRTL